MAKEKEESLSLTDPQVIMAFTFAFAGDVSFWLIVTHYYCGAVAYAFFWPKTKGWIAKLVLIIGILIPLPLLTIALGIAFFLTNTWLGQIVEKATEEAVKQAAIQLAAVATGGAGEVLEVAEIGGEVAMEGAEMAAEAAEAAKTAEATAQAGEALEGGGQAARGAEGLEGAEGAPKSAPQGPNISPEELGEELPWDEELQRELLEEPQEQSWEDLAEKAEQKEEESGFKRAKETFKKVQDIKEKVGNARDALKKDKDEEEDDRPVENIDEAA